MDWNSFSYGLLAGMVIAEASRFAGAATGRWASKRKAKAKPDDQLQEKLSRVRQSAAELDETRQELESLMQAPPRNPSSPWQWHAMPCGTRLELGDTGFYVVLDTKNSEQPYTGYTPEGDARARSNDLFQLKRFIEGEARERAEFTPVRGWQP